MKLTKFVHSCVLVEDGDRAVLFDPGSFGWSSGLVKIDQLPELEMVVITHKHGDHFSEDFVKALLGRWPELQFIAPPDTVDQLKALGVKSVSSASTDKIEVTVGDHAPVQPFADQVQNLVAHWAGKVTTPGDSHDFSETKDVLLLPVQAPWGTTIKAMQLVQELKPKYVVPIHDWMWNDQWRAAAYSRFQDIAQAVGTTFISLIDGEAQDIPV